MNKRIYFAVILVSACLFSRLAEGAEDGFAIMLKHHHVYEGEDSRAVMSMVLMNKAGKKRIREVLFWSLERGDEDKSLMYFLKPPGDKGTAFLTWEHKEKEDDQWLYLPVLNRVKRISSADKDKSFMGTDFSYNDLSPPHPEEFNHTLLEEASVDGQECFVVESIHKSHAGDPAYAQDKKYQYARQTSWIRKDNYLMVKATMFDRKEQPIKAFYASDIRQIEGIWTIMVFNMENLKSGHRTILTILDIEYNTGLNDDFFTDREMKKPR